MKVHVSAAGKVTDVEVVVSSGSKALDTATVGYMKLLCFKPGTDTAGNPVAATATVEYVWRLE